MWFIILVLKEFSFCEQSLVKIGWVPCWAVHRAGSHLASEVVLVWVYENQNVTGIWHEYSRYILKDKVTISIPVRSQIRIWGKQGSRIHCSTCTTQTQRFPKGKRVTFRNLYNRVSHQIPTPDLQVIIQTKPKSKAGIVAQQSSKIAPL